MRFYSNSFVFIVYSAVNIASKGLWGEPPEQIPNIYWDSAAIL
jgi:hypothetical protein